MQKGLDDIEAGRYIELNSREEIETFGIEISRHGTERLAQKEVGSPWPEGFFKLAGTWQGDFERPEQGELEIRDSFD